DAPYQKDDMVRGIVYEISERFGTFVAIDNCYSALIPRREGVQGLHIGDTIEARVTEVKEDGKIDLSVRQKAFLQMDADAQKVLAVMER
ncbi:S1 RNA-binding domain-containing protein, partial [Escherichia coli]|uniref:S1 RNA-binding domain-containing protein n=1 Tax=Escherichia coli TaxID=562 RepID=UPI0028DEA716